MAQQIEFCLTMTLVIVRFLVDQKGPKVLLKSTLESVGLATPHAVLWPRWCDTNTTYCQFMCHTGTGVATCHYGSLCSWNLSPGGWKTCIHTPDVSQFKYQATCTDGRHQDHQGCCNVEAEINKTSGGQLGQPYHHHSGSLDNRFLSAPAIQSSRCLPHFISPRGEGPLSCHHCKLANGRAA